MGGALPKAITVFEVRENISSKDVYDKLKGFSLARGSLEAFGRKFTLGVRVVELEGGESEVSGVYEEVTPHSLSLDSESVKLPRYIRINFHFTWLRQGIFLLVASGKRNGMRVSSTFSQALFERPDGIMPVYLPPQRLRELYMVDAEPRQVIFTGLREVAGVDTVVLYGKALSQSTLLKRYMQVGQEKYVVFKTEKGLLGASVGGLILAFSKLDEDEFRQFVIEKVIPRVEPLPV
ncbi:hypothetical protein MA03_04850 [Infirmifilum uzonense]|uniref:Uncharacterized protein n=1 Tax=Infirmifilum uzonense TaxID=1550241 RepID=A0A0F7FHQ8_9CREN|nr:hypothetical protein MA03_04850 [Infirmifilum uzonense]